MKNNMSRDQYIEERKRRADIQREKVANAQAIIVVGFDMPFKDMVNFMVKWTLATIPAVLILTLMGLLISPLFIGLSALMK